MTEIALGIAFFTGIVLLLVLVILVARSRLVATGRAEITVNGGTSVPVAVGGKLLDALTSDGIHLPAACGGSGTCGQCRLRVLEGGGDVLPTEKTRLTRREIRDGTRLACQVSIREDMAVEVPDEIFGVKQWTCRVRTNTQVASMIKELVLELPKGEPIDFRAGGYIQVTCPPYQIRYKDLAIADAYREDWDRFDLWRYEAGTRTPTTRAYSMANCPEENDVIMLNVRIAIPPPGTPEGTPPGVVSSYLFNLDPGVEVTVSGPYGHFFATETDAEMIFVGGGVGMAPMRSHILDQLKRLQSNRKISFWYGARNRREVLYRDEFDRLAEKYDNFQWSVALSEPLPDGQWTGRTGFIHDVLLDDYLQDHPAPEDCEYYLCGPPMMIKAVRRMLDNLGVDPDNIFFDDFGG
ncbi:MAG: NADH:ubiquinone reductase (Na(+)-transporting) subunit F [Alphaproteobacteria bacterium]|nr:NADH:ubiquinone reductase (Na(+)-transporting) subunit F [Alphaproteobacteria bacterium]